jgi:Lumazine binding domain
LGTVATIERDGGGCTLTISDAGPILGDCHVGDSIAVNGACLTVTRFDAQQNGGWFEIWLANETLERTDLGTHREETIRPHESLTLDRPYPRRAESRRSAQLGACDGTPCSVRRTFRTGQLMSLWRRCCSRFSSLHA